MLQKEMNKENTTIMTKAYELYEQQGFKDGNDFANWLEAERRVGDRTRSRREVHTKEALWVLVGFLCVLVAALLFTLLKKNQGMELSSKSLSELKVMMLVLDPKADEKVVVFGDTHFEFGKSTLTPEAKTLLDADVTALKGNPATHVRMAGYTSAMGTEAVNQRLSEDRANTVRNYLMEKGIRPGRITVIGYGRAKPAVYEVDPGDINSKEAKANMRVLFEIAVK